MKKNKKLKNKSVIKDLAEQFSQEFEAKLEVHILPNGDISYKDYIIRQLPNGNWGVFDKVFMDIKDEFHLKTCALMAAKSQTRLNLDRYSEIKRLDSQYWASFSDLQVYKKNIKTAQEFERYVILLNKLEETDIKHRNVKDKISVMFKWSFV
jgi:hypothetical protein